MALHQDQVSESTFFLNCICVGFDAPIDFNPGVMTHLLPTVQLAANKVLTMFNHRYYLPSHVNGDTADLREEMETTLNVEVLPHLDVTLMSIGSMERNFPDHIYVDNSEAIVPQMIGSFSAQTP